MGSCASCQRSSSLESAVKRSLSFPPSPFSVKQCTNLHGVSDCDQPPLSSALPMQAHHAAFGRKEDVVFESRPWLESDVEDDFFSVNGELGTPSQSNTPVPHSFFATTTEKRTTVPNDYMPGLVTEPPSPDKTRKLADLFQDSFRGGRGHISVDGIYWDSNGKLESKSIELSITL